MPEVKDLVGVTNMTIFSKMPNKPNGKYKAIVNQTSMLSCNVPIVANKITYECGDTITGGV